MGQDDLAGAEGVGGGMPLVDLWGRTMGVAVAHLEKGPRWVSLPVEVRGDGRVEVGLTRRRRPAWGKRSGWPPARAYETVTSAIIFHKGDYFAALAGYGDLLRARGVAIPRESPASAHEPYWKSWGFRKDVTVDKFMAKLPELAAMGIRTANLDDGWYDFAGDWQPNRAAGKFPGGGAGHGALRAAGACGRVPHRHLVVPAGRQPRQPPGARAPRPAGDGRSGPAHRWTSMGCTSCAPATSRRASTSATCCTAW